MQEVGKGIFRASLVLLLVMGFPFVSMNGQALKLELKTPAGEGWHPWYEIKGDPESARNLLICGTKWDPLSNSPLGFVYVSQDGGASWRTVLEDRSSSWVTEQSCTFGPNHSAYFVSEASRVIDGLPHHEEGTTRLFLSTDAGLHWAETVKTGWADYSTSAFSFSSGRVYTFYNSWYTTHESGANIGGTVGLLVFSSDGKKVVGPFFDATMRNFGYHGVFPTDAIALKNGQVVALYSAKRKTTEGWQEDLGIVRADQSLSPSLESAVIAHPSMDSGCFGFADASLAYDLPHDRLFLVYVDGCKATSQILMTSSGDGGRTWAKSVVTFARESVDRRIYSPTLVVAPGGALALLWEEGRDRRSGRWLFSYLLDLHVSGPQTELSGPSDNYEIRDDSLWTAVDRTSRLELDSPVESSSMTLTVLSELNNVWRGHGLIVAADKLVAVWPSQSNEGQQLNAGVIRAAASSRVEKSSTEGVDVARDVSRETVILYGGRQHFDGSNQILEVCLTLANRGKSVLRAPIRLEARGIRSPVGEVSILNATNGLVGEGATWDISPSLTGDQIPPGTMSNPFCLSLRMQLSRKNVQSSETDELLVLRLRVFASSENPADKAALEH